MKCQRHDFVFFFPSHLLTGASLESWRGDIRNVAQAARRAPDEGLFLQRHQPKGISSRREAHFSRNWALRLQVSI